MARSDKLLREAIADAKAVRETALANAKAALEEAFTPHRDLVAFAVSGLHFMAIPSALLRPDLLRSSSICWRLIRGTQ